MEEKSVQKIPVKKQYRHPINTKAKYDFDIMLIKLQRNATLNKMVSLVQLPNKKETVPDETKCLASGWGMTTPDGSSSDVLRAVTLSTESGKKCKKIWGRYFEPLRMVCSYFDGTNGICKGDSGGPLICNKKAHGIVSFTGTPCDKKIKKNKCLREDLLFHSLDKANDEGLKQMYQDETNLT